jgi:hypothetical protein
MSQHCLTTVSDCTKMVQCVSPSGGGVENFHTFIIELHHFGAMCLNTVSPSWGGVENFHSVSKCNT